MQRELQRATSSAEPAQLFRKPQLREERSHSPHPRSSVLFSKRTPVSIKHEASSPSANTQGCHREDKAEAAQSQAPEPSGMFCFFLADVSYL